MKMVIIGAVIFFTVGQGMEWKLLLTVFGAVFIAELGDKTQLATLLFAADHEVSRWTVFIGASLALIATSALGVLAGGAIAQFVSPKALSLVAGIGFIAIGALTLVRSW
jgi:putative Ca2+/H+ antiporter (TMEM165/GDT1 family)